MDEKNRILIVDDDNGMSETLSDILCDVDYDVDVANEGYTAIDLISKNSYDLVLMDIKMPEINGVETYKIVKNINPSLKVIMMTAYSVEDLVNEAISEGAYGIIYKPMNINNLLKIFDKILKNINILIVDDNPDFCRTLKVSLERMNYNIATKYDGEQAINYIKENDIDIIFIDVKLPGLNGLEVFLAIKKINPNIDAIMITGYQHNKSVVYQIKMAFTNNLYECFYKPLNLEEINSIVRKILRENLKIAGRGTQNDN